MFMFVHKDRALYFRFRIAYRKLNDDSFGRQASLDRVIEGSAVFKILWHYIALGVLLPFRV